MKELYTKIRESIIQLILANHNSYDDKRKELGYKKSSYYKS